MRGHSLRVINEAMSSVLYRIGRFAAHRPWAVIGGWLAVAVVVVGAAATFGRDLDDSMRVPGLDSQDAIDLLASAGSERAGVTARVVVAPADGVTFGESAPARAAVGHVEAAVTALPDVIGTIGTAAALAAGADEARATGVVSPDGRVAVVTVQYPVLEELDRTNLDELQQVVDETSAATGVQVELGGELSFACDEPESGVGEMAGVLIAVLILLVAFGSVIAMGLPIGIALFGLALGVSSMSLVTYLIDIPSWAPQIAGMVGLGVGIDYALFLVTRHREFLAQGWSVPDAAGRAVATAGQAVIFAGGTVVVAILGLGLAGVPFMTAAGVATSLVVLIMVIAAVTLLPAFLGLAGLWINRIGIHRRHVGAGTVGSGWTRWGRHVSAHAWGYAVGTTIVLLALTAPVLALRLGFPDEGTQPTSRTERRAYDLVAEGFGPGANGPLLIALELGDDPTVVDDVAAAVAADPGVAAVSPPEVLLDDGVATIVAFPTTAPQDATTLATVDRLRTEVLPDAVAGSGATAHVGGATANFGDIAGRVRDRLPLFVTAVIGLSFLLLMLLFRSILVPLKAAILNLLSIGASYGVLVMVFQWGWGSDLIGLETTVPIVSFVPMFMFAILFGLSMDYEVFLLSRVREEYLATGDNEASVVHGLAGTARVITSAALIMISVFGGFVLGNDPTTKMFGLGLAVAIFVDATIVRIVLVPATMKLMGDANWWLPHWLDRLLPNVDIDGDAALDPRFRGVSTTVSGAETPENRGAGAPVRSGL
ncbi:MMPL family transporter [soil metagenome]